MSTAEITKFGFDTDSDLSHEWDTVAGSVDLTGTLSRTGKGCLLISALGLGPTKQVSQHDHPLHFGAYYVPSAPTSNGVTIYNMYDSVGTQQQIVLKYNINLSLSIYSGGSSGTTLLATSDPGLVIPGAYNYIVIKALIANSGSCKVRLNGDLVINFTGDTQATANAWVDNIGPAGRSGGGEMVDDWHVWTWTAGGDDITTGPRIYPAMAVSDSTPLQWATSTGSGTHANFVNTIPPDLTKWVQTSTSGNVDQYVHAVPANQQTPALPGSPSLLTVTHKMLARLDTGTGRKIASDVGGVASATEFSLASGWRTFATPYDTNPATASAWAYGDLPTTPFGPKCTV